jgi:vacuolar iron transporter family protein
MQELPCQTCKVRHGVRLLIMSLQDDRPTPDPAPTNGWLARKIGTYLPDLVFGASDGIITTLAIVSGVVGADLSTTVILILGFANLLADGFSMGASNVLSRRSDLREQPLPTVAAASRHGLATFIGFVAAGIVPLSAYLLPWFDGVRFAGAVALALATLFAVGAGRAFFTRRGWLASGLEMLSIGALAAVVAYAVGALGAQLVSRLGV